MNSHSEARRFEVFTIRDYMQDRLHMRPPHPKNDITQNANGNNIVQAGGDITGNVDFTPRSGISF